MKTVSKFLALAILVSGTFAQANAIQFRCTANSEQECTARATELLTRMSCEPSAVDCQFETEVDDNGNPAKQVVYCKAKAEKCYEPAPSLFASTYCAENHRKASMLRYDSKLTLGYAMGIFGWVRSLCVTP